MASWDGDGASGVGGDSSTGGRAVAATRNSGRAPVRRARRHGVRGCRPANAKDPAYTSSLPASATTRRIPMRWPCRAPASSRTRVSCGAACVRPLPALRTNVARRYRLFRRSERHLTSAVCRGPRAEMRSRAKPVRPHKRRLKAVCGSAARPAHKARGRHIDPPYHRHAGSTYDERDGKTASRRTAASA